jgi:integrase
VFVSVILPRRVYNDSSGGFYDLPVLHAEGGHFDSLLDYCLDNRNKSKTWMRKLVFDVQLLMQYMYANPHEKNSELLFQNFASKLQTGTFNPETGHDPSGLGWRGRTPYNSQQTVTRLRRFLDWLGKKNHRTVNVSPLVTMTAADKAVHDCAELYRRRYSLLGHLWKPSPQSANALKALVERGPQLRGEPPAFPEDRFDELMERGFNVGGRINYRDQAITLLMHGAGFRLSEPMHLFIGDVTRNPAKHYEALVRIHHPTLGDAPPDLLDERGRPIRCNRQEYLQRKFGLAPRVDLISKKDAGWKGVVLDDRFYLQAYWFKPDYAELFLEIWNKYMEQVADIPLRQRKHPYAFMNIYRAPKGSIYSQGKFELSHGRACERIGLSVERRLGTTPHGHRHAYGRRLSKAGLDPAVIKKCMHHSSEKSQEIYTGRTANEVFEALESAFKLMQS